MNGRRLVIIGFLGLLVASGCFANNPIEKRKELKNCDFLIKKVRLTNVGITSLTLDFDIDIYNPNQIDVVLEKMDIDLWVNDSFVGRGFNRSQLTIKSREDNLCSFSANIKYAGTYQAIKGLVQKIKNQEPLNYRLSGKVYYQTIFGDIAFPFESKTKSEE